MHFPLSFDIAGLSIKFHLISEFLAYAVGFRFYLYLRKKNGDEISDANRIWIIIGAIAGAVIGSRIVGGFESISHFQQASQKLMYVVANKSIVGGLLGGVWGVELCKKFLGEKKRSGDLFVFPILLALIIGRMGCLSMGIFEDVAGYPTHFFTGMDLGDGIMRHPLMLYEIIFLSLLWYCLNELKNHYSIAQGSLFRIFMMAYLIFRLFIEFLKPHESYIWGMGAIQLACVAGLVYYGNYFPDSGKIFSWKKG